MSQNNLKHAGFSLIEMMVAMSILSMAVFLTWKTFNKQEQIRVKASAKMQTNNSLEQLMELIKRDQHHTVLTTDMQLVNAGLGLQLRPIRPNQDDPDLKYTVTFESKCKQISGNSNLRKIYRAPHLSTIYAAANSCLAKLNCRRGQYPTVEITTTGTGAPAYSPSTYPTFGKSVLEGPTGIALCVEQRAGHAFLWTESVLVEGEAGAYKVKVVTRPLLLPAKVASDMVFLPN